VCGGEEWNGFDGGRRVGDEQGSGRNMSYRCPASSVLNAEMRKQEAEVAIHLLVKMIHTHF